MTLNADHPAVTDMNCIDSEADMDDVSFVAIVDAAPVLAEAIAVYPLNATNWYPVIEGETDIGRDSVVAVIGDPLQGDAFRKHLYQSHYSNKELVILPADSDAVWEITKHDLFDEERLYDATEFVSEHDLPKSEYTITVE